MPSPGLFPRQSSVNSCIYGLSPRFRAPATAGSLRIQTMSPRVMSDS
jgi:hypothetical protein